MPHGCAQLMTRYRLYRPMGAGVGEVEFAVPTIEPGETVAALHEHPVA